MATAEISLTAANELAQQFIRGVVAWLDNTQPLLDSMVGEMERLEPQPIESEFRDGFIPWTHGGWMVSAAAPLSDYRWRSGTPAEIESLLVSGDKIAADEWERVHPEKEFSAAIAGDYGEELRDSAEDAESDYWSQDCDCVYWKTRAMYLAPGDRQNQTGEAEVYFDAYLCTDSYGRDSIGWLSCYPSGNPNQTRGEFKRTLTLRELLRIGADGVAEMIAAATADLGSL